MSDRVVVLSTFPNEPAALMARALLEANGIPCIISADGASGFQPQFLFAQGVRLSVREADVESARELLESTDEESSDTPS